MFWTAHEYQKGKSGGNAICWCYIELFAVKCQNSLSGSSYHRGSIKSGTWFLAKMLMLLREDCVK